VKAAFFGEDGGIGIDDADDLQGAFGFHCRPQPFAR